MTTDINALWERVNKATTINTKEQAEGRRAIVPADKYSNCRIETGEPSLSQYTDKKTGEPKLQMKVNFICPDYDGDLSKYITIYEDGGMGEGFKILCAVWPKPEDRIGKRLLDCNGAVVDIMVTHKENNLNKGTYYADYTYYPAKSAAPKKG